MSGDHAPSFASRVVAAYGLEMVTEAALRLREARIAHGMTQAQAAKALGVSREYPDAHTTRSQLGHDGFHAPGDVVAIPGVVIEVKDVASSAWPTWCAQATQEARGRPWVVIRKKRGTADVGEWWCVGSEQTWNRSPRPRPGRFGAWLAWWESDEDEVPA